MKQVIDGAAPQAEESTSVKSQTQFKVYDDEVPPIALDDYTPMEIEDEITPDQSSQIEEQPTYEKFLPLKIFPPHLNYPP